MAIRTMQPVQYVLDKYDDTRAKYKSMAEGTMSALRSPITDHHGFFLGQQNWLTERFAGLDKLFYTLIQGIVEDPDYAVKKDTKIYDKMMRDPQIFYCLAVRKAATSSLPWILKPPDGMENDSMAQKIAAMVEKRLKRIPRFSELLDNILDALLPGLSVNELVWKVGTKGEYVVAEHYPINKDRILFDKDGNPRLRSPRAPTVGLEVPPYKFITHTFNVTDGSWKAPETAGYAFYGKGLADTPLYHYFYFKMLALKFLMKELERFGLPFKIIYSGPQNEKLAAKMAQIMAALKNDAVVSIPGKKGEINVDVVRATRSGNIFMLFLNYVDTLITKAILGQELMTEMPGVGSYAAAQIHRSVFATLSERDRLLVRDTLSRTIVRYDLQLNAPNLAEEYYPIFDFKHAAVEDTSVFLDTVESAVNMGIAVSEKQVREFTGLREPLEGEKVVQRRPEIENVPPGMSSLRNNVPSQRRGANTPDKKVSRVSTRSAMQKRPRGESRVHSTRGRTTNREAAVRKS